MESVRKSIIRNCNNNNNHNASAENEVRRGPWTIDEDTLLTHYIACHGEGHWNNLAKYAGLFLQSNKILFPPLYFSFIEHSSPF